MRKRSESTRRLLAATAPVIGLAALWATPVWASFDQKNGKILEFGWDTPSSPDLKSQINAGQQLPFQGVVTDLIQNSPVYGAGDPRDLFSWNVWGTQTLSAQTYSNAASALNSTDLGKLSNSFLRFNITPGQIDWFANYSSVLANAQLAASLTTQGRLKGIFLDTEEYQGKLFSYPAQPQNGQHTFAQYEQQARVVGGEFMQAWRAANPNVQVMLTYGYGTGGTPAQLPTSDDGLLPSFIDGLLDQATPSNIVYDGYESSYGFTTGSQFENAYQTMRVSDASASGNTAKFATNYRASFGLWVDKSPAGGDATVWDTQNFNNNYYTPSQLGFVLQEAVKRSDQYVWLYSHQTGWWNNNAPQAYLDAVANVRRVGQLERFGGSTKDTANWEQHTEQSGIVTQNSHLSINAVNAFTASEADYTTKSVNVQVGGEVSVEVLNNTSTSNSGLAGAAKLGLILSNNSGGTSASALTDSRALMILWSNADNSLYAGVSDSTGSNRLTQIANVDHPTNTTWLYQIERLSLNTARFSVLDMNQGTPIGTPQTLSFSDMPANLSISLFAQAGNATFSNVWVASVGWALDGSGDWNNPSNWCTSTPNAVDATAIFGGAITAPRTVFTDTPTTVGTLRFDSSSSYEIAGQGALTISVSSGTGSVSVLQGNHKINLPLTFASDTTINVAPGASLTISDPATIKANKTVTESGSVAFQAPLTLESGASLVAGSGALSVLGAPSLGAGATIDIKTQSIEIAYGNAASPSKAVQAEIARGFAGGAWNRDGITSSSTIAGVTGVGWKDDSDSRSILVSYAYYGDANLDGQVNTADFAALATNFNATGEWISGDFNYDGVVNALDFNLLAANFGAVLPPPTLGSLVPEPGSFVLFGIVESILVARRGNRRRTTAHSGKRRIK